MINLRYISVLYLALFLPAWGSLFGQTPESDPCANCLEIKKLSDEVQTLRRSLEEQRKLVSSLKAVEPMLSWYPVIGFLGIAMATLSLLFCVYFVSVTRKRVQKELTDSLREIGLL